MLVIAGMVNNVVSYTVVEIGAGFECDVFFSDGFVEILQ